MAAKRLLTSDSVPLIRRERSPIFKAVPFLRKSFMPKFAFHITRNVTETAIAVVDAETIDDAHEIALSPDYYEDAPFCLDEDSDWEVYLPDPDAYEVL